MSQMKPTLDIRHRSTEARGKWRHAADAHELVGAWRWMGAKNAIGGETEIEWRERGSSWMERDVQEKSFEKQNIQQETIVFNAR